MKHIFIINPKAGKGSNIDRIYDMADVLRARHGLDVMCILTQSRGHATAITREFAESGGEYRFYACGGDGTINEVANGIAGFPNAAMTAIPIGTGNDFLKNFGPKEILFSDAENLFDGEVHELDLIDCNGHLALTIACSGIDARVAADVHRYTARPQLDGKTSYLIAVARNVLLKELCSHWTLHIDGKAEEADYTLIAVCNGRYYGGGFMPMPEAMPDDGVLDMLHVNRVSLYQLPALLGKYAKGRYRELPKFVTDYHGQSITFSSDEEITAVVDGEVMHNTAFTVRLSERKVNFFYPAGASYQVEFSTPNTQEKATL